MAPGDSGAICTIPAVFIENADGVVIANEMANGPVVAFMGTRYFANNLTINPADVIRPKAASNLQLIHKITLNMMFKLVVG